MRWSILALIPAIALGLGSLAAAPDAVRQNAEPAHPAAFHTGDCESPSAEPAAILTTVGTQETTEGEPVDASDTLGRLTTEPVLSGAGIVDTPLESLLDEGNPYVLVVHESEQAMDSLLACGEVAGPVVDEQITLALRPLEDSDYAGIAVLGTTDDGGTGGTVLLFADVNAFGSDDDNGRNRGQGTSGGVGTGGQAPAGGISGDTDTDTDTDAGTDGDTDTDGPRRTRVPRTRTPGDETPGAETPTAPAATSTAPAATSTSVPPTEAPPTEVPPTEVPPTGVPPTEVPPTEPPPTEPPPTTAPTVAPTP